MAWSGKLLKPGLNGLGFVFLKKNNYIINIYDKNPRNKFMNKM
jgi:hypothetical protein